MMMFNRVILLLTITGLTASTLQSAEHESGIEGTITIGPLHGGPIRQGESGSSPLANAPFTIANDKRERVASFHTDENGHFAIALPPGHYTVTHDGERIGMHGFGPFEVSVVALKMTQVDWHTDTGMR